MQVSVWAHHPVQSKDAYYKIEYDNEMPLNDVNYASGWVTKDKLDNILEIAKLEGQEEKLNNDFFILMHYENTTKYFITKDVFLNIIEWRPSDGIAVAIRRNTFIGIDLCEVSLLALLHSKADIPDNVLKEMQKYDYYKEYIKYQAYINGIALYGDTPTFDFDTEFMQGITKIYNTDLAIMHKLVYPDGREVTRLLAACTPDETREVYVQVDNLTHLPYIHQMLVAPSSLHLDLSLTNNGAVPSLKLKYDCLNTLVLNDISCCSALHVLTNSCIDDTEIIIPFERAELIFLAALMDISNSYPNYNTKFRISMRPKMDLENSDNKSYVEPTQMINLLSKDMQYLLQVKSSCRLVFGSPVGTLSFLVNGKRVNISLHTCLSDWITVEDNSINRMSLSRLVKLAFEPDDYSSKPAQEALRLLVQSLIS